MSGAKVLFVTATDTEAGKTFVSCAVARALRGRGRDVGVMKPVASGCEPDVSGALVSDDARELVGASGADDAFDLVTPVAFGPPLAPTAAARASGARFERGRIFDAFETLRSRHEFLIVEGIGGLLVPLEGAWTVRDLARELEAPIVIVSRDALGTINHTALTVESARSGGLELRGVVLNRLPGTPPDLSCETNAREIEELTGVRVVARIGPVSGHDAGHDEPARAFNDEALGTLFGTGPVGKGGP
ncbi:MAG: dethiobiotin synthase [Planctomycetota bacterium]